MTELNPVVPVEVGRDNYVDGTQGSNIEYSQVRVINITPHEVSEIKTSVITLEPGMFPVTSPGNTTPQISVCSVDVTAGYVQWEPMGDLHPVSPGCPLGSYKYLRVKWDCYIPAGSDSANYAVNGAIKGPYPHYAEKIYRFRSLEPATDPQFTLTNPVLSALGALNSTAPMHFEFSAHGYVNKFTFASGLYGQDKQTAFPDGSSILLAKREPIFDRYQIEQGDVNEPPTTQQTTCLAKEYMVHGRIVPELDFDGAAFEVKVSGNPDPAYKLASSYGTSGRDAPPFWYNLYYELQHNKNIIPFTFIWGVGLLTYDQGAAGSLSENFYDPRGALKDLPDVHGRLGGIKGSSNHGPRARSFGAPGTWVDTVKPLNSREADSPNIFWSDDDITFSVVGPDVVCHASSVNVCAVYDDTVNGLKRTILNWFDKSNQSWYDVEVYGYNALPYSSTWVLRGCIHVNNNYLPNANLSTRDINSQSSNSLERTWAIDLNFGDRKLFTTFKNTIPKPPQEYITRQDKPGGGKYTDSYQSAAYLAEGAWDDNVTIDVTYIPLGLTTTRAVVGLEEDHPYYNQPNFEDDKRVGLLKNLKEPWAMNPHGLAARAGIPGGQAGFNYVGIGATLAGAGLPDARFLEASVDLDWICRLSVEADRDGKIVDHFDTAWIAKRQVAAAPTLNFPSLNKAVRELTNNPSYVGWLNKSINDPEFAGAQRLIDETSILGYYGSNVAWSGEEAIAKFNRGVNASVHGGSKNNSKVYGHPTFNRVGRIGGAGNEDHLIAIDLTTFEDTSLGICDTEDTNRNFRGLTFDSIRNTFYSIAADDRKVYTIRTTDGSAVLIGSQPNRLPYDVVQGVAYNPLDGLIYGLGVRRGETYSVTVGEVTTTYRPHDYYTFTVNPDTGLFISEILFENDRLVLANDGNALNRYKGIAFRPSTNTLLGIKRDYINDTSYLVQFNSTRSSTTTLFEVPYEEVYDLDFLNTDELYSAARVDLGNRDYEQPLLKINLNTQVITEEGVLERSEELGGRLTGIAINTLTNQLRAINYRRLSRFQGFSNFIGYPTPKHQHSKGYPTNGHFYSNTTREGFTPSHSAHGNLISYAMISGDLVSIKLCEYFMRVIMSSHNDGEHARKLFYDQFPVKWRNAGRMEGRPLHGLVMALSVSRDRVLRERAICMLSRRFWNLYNVQEFEDSPLGVPGKPWISLWYPPWGGGRYTNLDQDGHPVYRFDSEVKSESSYYWPYYKNYAEAGNIAQRKYNVVGIPIEDIAPNIDRERAAVWHWNDVPQAQKSIYVDAYNEMDYVENPLGSGFIKRGAFLFKEEGLVPGNPNPVNIDYLAYKPGYDDHPLRYHIIAPSVTGSLNGTSALPSVTAIPSTDKTGVRLNTIFPSDFTTQGYQQSLCYPYFYPMLEVFNTYSTIFAARSAAGEVPDFVAKYNTYNELSQELADTYEYFKTFLIRLARTIANCLLIPTDPASPLAGGRYCVGYFYAAYSKAKPFEWFIDSENTLSVAANGSVQMPVMARLDGSVKRAMSSYALGGYYSNSQNINGSIKGNPFGTIGWAFNAPLMSWDILYKYSDLSNPYNFESIRKLESYINDYLGPSNFDITQINNNKMFRDAGSVTDAFYGKFYGRSGWPNPGKLGPKTNNIVGSGELLPWFVGAADEVWRDRSIDLTLKTLTGKIEGSTTLSSEIQVTRNNTLKILANGEFQGSSNLSAPIRRIRTFTRIPRDEGNESYYPTLTPQVVNVPGGGGGSTVHYIPAYFAGSTSVSAEGLIKTTYTSGTILGNSNLNAEIMLPGILECNLFMSSTYEVDSILKSNYFNGLITSGSMSVSSDNIEAYIKLSDSVIGGSTIVSANALYLTELFTGSMALSGLSTSAAIVISSLIQPNGILGEIILDSEIEALTFEGEILGQTILDSELERVANYIGGESNYDSFVNVVKENTDSVNPDYELSSVLQRRNYRSQRVNFESALFDELAIRSNDEKKVSEIYKQTLQSLIGIFSTFVYKNDENKMVKVPCWHGSAERVVAKMKQESTTILPVASVYRIANKNDEKRRRSSSLIAYETYWDKEKQRAVRIASLAPTPVNISYRLNIWTKYQEDMDHITEQVHRVFNPDLQIITEHNIKTKSFLLEESENTETDIPDGQDRVIRKVFTIDVQSYIPNPKFLITNTGKIEEFNVENYVGK